MKTIRRGEVWLVNFEPSVGTEIQKIRPAVVVQEDGLSILGRTIVVPITSVVSVDPKMRCGWVKAQLPNPTPFAII